MQKQMSSRCRGWALVLLALALPMACGAGPGGDSGSRTGSAPPGVPVASNQAKGFGEAVLVPAIELEGWASLIAYKRDGMGFFEAYGDDTRILRAGGPAIESLEESERLLGGERKLAGYSSSRVLEERIFSRRSGGEVEDRYLVLSPVEGGIAVEGKEGRFLYARTAEGGLRIERSGPAGREIEEYRPDGSSRRSKEGKLIAEGGVREKGGDFEYFERSPEDADGSLELFYTLLRLGRDRFRTEVGKVEPIAWVLIEGLSAALSGERPLENLALLDQIMGQKRRVTPLLALSYLGRLPPQVK